MNKIILFLVLFFLLGAFFIISNENLSLRDPADRDAFTAEYLDWFAMLFSHSVKVTGYVVDSGWLPASNSTLD